MALGSFSAHNAKFSGDGWQLCLKLADYVPPEELLEKVLTLPAAPK
jgi:hypothetical protein